MTILIIIYLIIVCWYKYSNLKQKSSLMVNNNGEFLIELFTVIFFLIFFIFFLRVLSLFRETQVLDLKNIVFDFSILNLVLYLVLILSLRKLIIYKFKLSWFKMHYVMMCQNNNWYYEKYPEIFYNFVYTPAFKYFKYFFYLNYYVVFLLLCFVFYDLWFNNLILNSSLWYLKYYSLFRLLYMCYKFMALKQNVLLDYYSYNLMYPGNIEYNFFYNFKDDEHQLLMEESKKYVSGIILEKIEYQRIYFGDSKKMAYFEKITFYK